MAKTTVRKTGVRSIQLLQRQGTTKVLCYVLYIYCNTWVPQKYCCATQLVYYVLKKTFATLGHHKSIAALHNWCISYYTTFATLGHHESIVHFITLILYQHYRIVHAPQLFS